MRAITAVIVVSLMAAGPAFADPTAHSSPAHPSHSRGKKPSERGKKKPPPADHPKAAAKGQARPARGQAAAPGHPAAAGAHPGGAVQPGLTGMSAAAVGAADRPDPGNPAGVSAHLDLSPQRQSAAISHAADRRGSERTAGLTMGGTSWKAEAVQVGVMAATFGALLGLCGHGNCALPSVLPSDRIGAPANLDIRREEPHPRSAR